MRAALPLALSLGLLTTACSRSDDNHLEVFVDALIAESDSLADKAHLALVSRGRESIVILETGLYRADPAGRRRIIRALLDIGEPEARPILAHLAEHDADPEVRDAAHRALERLGGRAEAAP